MLDRICVGDVPAKHHTQLRGPGGELRYEECITREGFDGPYTIVYHQRRPHTARVVPARASFTVARPAEEAGLLRRRHFDTNKAAESTTALSGRTPILFNKDVVLSVSRPTGPDTEYFVNGDGDDLFFAFQGGGRVITQFGELAYEKNDYVCLPKGTIYRFVPNPGEKHFLVDIECLGGVGLLKQARNAVGQLRMDAPYCHRDFQKPVFGGPVDEKIRHVVVKRRGLFTGMEYDESPLDLVGYDGSVYPWVFPILAFQPRVSSVHLPPTWHGTFSARGALVCSFVPRLVDFHPEAIPCPYPHASVDVDELIFYCDGNFTSRKGVGPGSVSFHPAGIPHGPHPGSYEGSIGAKSTNELAVMLDCYDPLTPTAAAVGMEDAAYHESFR